MRNNWKAPSALLLSFLLAAPLFGQIQAAQSDAFVDSAGVSIHLHYTQTPYYLNFPLIKSSLIALGIRHTRDGLIDTTLKAYYDRHNELAASGIKGIYITNASQSASLIQSWPANVAAAFEGYENPNELDLSTGGIDTLKTYVPALYSAAKAGKYAGYAVIGPSLTQVPSYAKLGNQSAYMDAGNLHNYFAGRNPGTAGFGGSAYGSIAFSMTTEKIVSGTKPIITTETGYTNETSVTNWVPENVAAIYMPRVFLEQWNAGIKRTYIYELLSEGGEDFGLMRADGTYKPAYYAVANLLNLLADKGTSFTTQPLDITLTGADSSVHKLLLQKRDGSYYLALWIEKTCYDQDKHVPIAVAPQNITLTSSHALSNLTTYQWGADGQVTQGTLTSGTSVPVTVTDKLLIVKMSPSNTWSLNLKVTPSDAGTVATTPSSADLKFAPGTSVMLSAKANTGYTFDSYSGAVTSYGSSAYLTASSNASVTATFRCTYALGASTQVVTGAGGTVTVPYTAGASCATLPTVSSSWLTATASNGVLSITAAANAGGPRTATVTLGSAQIAVTQSIPSIIFATLSSNVAGGYLSLDGKPYVVGSKLRLTAGTSHTLNGYAPQNVGGKIYLFNAWTAGVSGAEFTTVTAPTTNVTYAAQFVPGYYLNAYGATGGTVTLSSPGAKYGNMPYFRPTDVVAVTAVPNTGCTFQNWTGASTSTSNPVTVTTSASQTLIARFTCKR